MDHDHWNDRTPATRRATGIKPVAVSLSNADGAAVDLPAAPAQASPAAGTADEGLLHPKYHLPARCFAYVGRADAPTRWKLPYRHADGSVDHARLPKAVQSILSNYRGLKVGSIPDNGNP